MKILDHRAAFRFQVGQLVVQEVVQLIAEKNSDSCCVACCAVKKNVIVASRSYDVADVQFTIEKEDPLERLQFIQK